MENKKTAILVVDMLNDFVTGALKCDRGLAIVPALSLIHILSAILMQDPSAAQYLQCQMRFSMMMADVYKIISEVADLGFDPSGNSNA